MTHISTKHLRFGFGFVLLTKSEQNQNKIKQNQNKIKTKFNKFQAKFKNYFN